MKGKVVRFVVCFLAAVLLICAGGYFYRDHRVGNFLDDCELYVRPGMTVEGVVEYLDSAAGVKSKRSLLAVMRRKKVSQYLKPGYYVVPASTSSVGLARMLNNGWQTPVSLVLEGSIRRPSDVARRISRQMMVSQEEVMAALSDSLLLDSYGFTPSTVMAMIIPATYRCYWSEPVGDILNRLKKAYDAYWTAENEARAAAQGLSRMEVSILASIVQGESKYEPEQPRIAGVYLNRLRKGMLLQADPTVAYIFNYQLTRILFKHLKVDSPYNTYRYKGLPPGPICSPSKSCLEAVLNPDCKDGFIFFCANPNFDGTHVFAKTVAEHTANARAFQRELTRRQREKAKEAASKAS